MLHTSSLKTKFYNEAKKSKGKEIKIYQLCKLAGKRDPQPNRKTNQKNLSTEIFQNKTVVLQNKDSKTTITNNSFKKNKGKMGKDFKMTKITRALRNKMS